MLPLILSLLVGAGAGAALGYFGKCSSGACPLTSSWPRGALFGAVLGWMLYMGPGRELAGARALRDPDSPVRDVTAGSFDAQVLEAEAPVVVDFYATWCGPCKVMAPRLARLAEAYEGRVKFAKVDVDREAELATKFGVTALPTLVLFRAGKPVDTLVGTTDERTLRSRLDALVGAKAS